MRHLAFLCMLLCIVGCARAPNPFVKVVETEEMTWIAMKIANKYEHKDGQRLRLEHSYVYYDNKFTGWHFEFSSQEILEVRQAQGLIVDLVEDILREVNQNPIVGTQVASYPFGPERLHIEINFETYLGQYVDPYYVGCVELKHNMAYIYAFTLKDQDLYRWNSRVEPYWKVREIVMADRAAQERYEEEHPFRKYRHLDELYIPDEDELTPDKRRFSKYLKSYIQ